MRRRAKRLIVWSFVLAVPAAVVVTAVVQLSSRFAYPFWQDKLLFHVPLMVVPVAAVWLFSVPRLWLLLLDMKKKEAEGDVEAEAALRRQAGAVGLAFPYAMSALGSLTALYYAFVSPVPFRWMADLPPLGVLAVALLLVWLGLHGRLRRFVPKPAWLRWLRGLGVTAVVAGIAWGLVYLGLEQSRLPGTVDMMSGSPDYGGGAVNVHHHGGGQASAVSVTTLTGSLTGTPDRRVELTAEKKTVQLPDGASKEVWAYNGQVPGPELRFKEGELVEVTLVNRNIEEGVTVHWHGLDVPNAEDGVAGATQDAVMPGKSFTYRFRPAQVGTFWYHSHQDSKEAVQHGLFGLLVVEPKTAAFGTAGSIDMPVMVYEAPSLNASVVSGSAGLQRVTAAPGTQVRLRLINTQDWRRVSFALVGVPYRVEAIDGTALHEPGLLTDTRLTVTTGGRYDIAFEMPSHPVYLNTDGKRSQGLLLSPDGSGAAPELPVLSDFDPLHYGTPAPTPFGSDSKFDREFTMILDNRFGFYNGAFGSLYTINGRIFPDTPIFMVREGELVKTTIVNRGFVDHPMHLHGHHMLVLSRNGVPAAGTPLLSDTLDVLPGDTYEVAFRADNPGIWMDHCHNLTHAAAGMSMHLMYEGVTTPFAVGADTGNHPE